MTIAFVNNWLTYTIIEYMIACRIYAASDFSAGISVNTGRALFYKDFLDPRIRSPQDPRKTQNFLSYKRLTYLQAPNVPKFTARPVWRTAARASPEPLRRARPTFGERAQPCGDLALQNNGPHAALVRLMLTETTNRIGWRPQ